MSLLNLAGRPIRVSPSGAETAALCKRKDVFRRVLGLPDKPSAGAELGTQVHAIAEEYLIHGDGPTSPVYFKKGTLAWRILENGLAFLPKTLVPGNLGKDWTVERRLSHEVEGLPVIGMIDLEGPVDGIRLIADWKTSSSPTFDYAKTADQLKDFVQPNTYAYVLGTEDGLSGGTKIRFQHINLATKPVDGRYNVLNVVTDTTFADVQAVWRAKIVPYAGWLRKEAEDFVPLFDDPDAMVARVLQVPATVQACGAFGGCPYKAVCPAAQRMKDMPTAKDALRAQLSINKEAEAQAQQPAAPQKSEADPLVALVTALRTRKALSLSMARSLAPGFADMDELIAQARARHGATLEVKGNQLCYVGDAAPAPSAPAKVAAPVKVEQQVIDKVENVRRATIGLGTPEAKEMFRAENPGVRVTHQALVDWLALYDLALDEDTDRVLDVRPQPEPEPEPEVADAEPEEEEAAPPGSGVEAVIILVNVYMQPGSELNLINARSLDLAVAEHLLGWDADARNKLYSDGYGNGWKALEAQLRQPQDMPLPGGFYTCSSQDQVYRLVGPLADLGAVVMRGVGA